ncbi:hypothetical protein GCM10010429_21740 [Micromonospora olivasterospora]
MAVIDRMTGFAMVPSGGGYGPEPVRNGTSGGTPGMGAPRPAGPCRRVPDDHPLRRCGGTGVVRFPLLWLQNATSGR